VPKLGEAIRDQEKLKELRDNTLPVITLYHYPRKKRFQEIRLHLRDHDYWPRKTGAVFEVKIRNKAKFRAKLLSCVFKSVANLETQDALAEGFSGAGPLVKLKSHLKRRWRENPQWQGEKTQLYILTFEKV
jgi:hypothetical protein